MVEVAKEAEVPKEAEMPKEAGAANMVCPNCNTFQPRALVCDQCGVVIEKVLNANKPPLEKKTTVDDKPKTNGLWLVLLIVCLIFYYSKKENEEAGIVSPNVAPQNAPTQPISAGEEPEPLAAIEPELH